MPDDTEAPLTISITVHYSPDDRQRPEWATVEITDPNLVLDQLDSVVSGLFKTLWEAGK